MAFRGPSSFRVEHNTHNAPLVVEPGGMCAGRWPACAHVHEACLIRRMSPWACRRSSVHQRAGLAAAVGRR